MEQKRKERLQSRILFENPYDIETVFESLSIASKAGKEIHFMDKFIDRLRNDSNSDITDVSCKILQDLNLI